MQDNREYRNLQVFENKPEFKISGYAALWDTYLLGESDGVKIYERVDRHAFDNADMTDIVLRIDHNTGKVFARTSNGTLTCTVDAKGLFIEADLSRTEAGKELHNEIAQGMYKSMSWAFVVDDDGDSYDAKTRTRNILKVKKVYDCAVVSHAANPATSVQARSAQDYFTGVVKPVLIQELEERQAIEQRNNAIDEYLANIRKAVKK